MKLAMTVFFMMMFLSIESRGNDLNKAMDLYLNNDFLAAQELVSAPSYSENAKALYLMALLAGREDSPFKSPKKVVEYSEKSARLGFPAAISNLGISALSGEWGAVDYPKAKDLLEKAVALGDRKAQYGLAFMYERGLGVDLSLPKSMALLASAAEKGDMDAAYKLGVMLQEHPDHSTGLSALTLFKRAAELGSAPGALLWAKACALGEQTDRNLDEAYKGFKFAADAGLPLAQVNLGQFYQNGWRTKRNTLLAYKYYWLASADLQSADYQLDTLTRSLSQGERAEVEEKKAEWRDEAQRVKAEINLANRRESLMTPWLNDGP